MKSELKPRISDRYPLFSGIGARSRQKTNPEPLNSEPLNPYQDVYDHAGRTRAAIHGFIKYLLVYGKLNERKVTLNGEL
jgi:hypothetical protein